MKPVLRWAIPLSCGGNLLAVGSSWSLYLYRGPGPLVLLAGALLAALATVLSLHLAPPGLAWKPSLVAGGVMGGLVAYLFGGLLLVL